MRILLKNIHQLLTLQGPAGLRRGSAMQQIGLLTDAWLAVVDGRVAACGSMDSCPDPNSFTQVTDCTGRVVLPGYVDSHTHLVFAHTREAEFVQRIAGQSYEEIAAAGGGILNSARRLQATSEEQLLEAAVARAWEVLRTGTTTIEIKSGYGLTVAAELKMLRVARAIAREVPIRVRTTLLAAHALPLEYRAQREQFIAMCTEQLIPQAAAVGMADYVDVFCEKGFFTVEECRTVLQCGIAHGLPARVHAHQLSRSGGVALGVALGARSVDHLECMNEEDIACLAASETMATLLPGAAFFLHVHYPPAQQMQQAGLALALASDYNPGTSPSGNMNLMMSLACTQMKLLPETALTAATHHGAVALDMAHEVGSLSPGHWADLLVTEPISSYACIPYSYGRSLIARVMVGGRWVVG